jgi:hypothetical protein
LREAGQIENGGADKVDCECLLFGIANVILEDQKSLRAELIS